MRSIPGRLLLVLIIAGLAGCQTPVSPSSPASPHAPGSPTSPASSPSPAAAPTGSVFGTVQNIPVLTQTADGLYLATNTGKPGQTPPNTTLEHVSPAAGQVTARHVFGAGYLSPPVTGAGSLWATLSNSHGETLYRLNPVSLAPTGHVLLTSSGQAGQYATETANRVAFAGGAVWAAAVNQFDRVSPGSLRVSTTVPFPGADSSDLGASSDGHVLIVSEAKGGVGTIQRRDPATGAQLASHPMTGVVAAHVGGVADTGVWIDEPTGMMGYVERFTAADLTPQPDTIVRGTNGIRSMLADGSLWVTSQVGGAKLNYCADPATGERRAQIPLPNPDQDYLLAVGPQDLYYTVPASNGFRIERASVPAACRA